jgi:hypothetical protein
MPAVEIEELIYKRSYADGIPVGIGNAVTRPFHGGSCADGQDYTDGHRRRSSSYADG